MTKSVTEPVQQRDEAVQPAPLVTKQVFRGPEERVVLVTERNAAWDRPRADLPSIDEPAFDSGVLGPMPTQWTHDLVHCRLLTVHAMMARLPSVKVPGSYRSFLGALQSQEAGLLRKPLSPEEVVRFDWTWSRISRWPERDRAIIMGLMSDKGVRTVEKILAGLEARGIGKALKRSAVSNRYKAIRTTMAGEWIVLREHIDSATREAWLSSSQNSR